MHRHRPSEVGSPGRSDPQDSRSPSTCQRCDQPRARHYQRYRFVAPTGVADPDLEIVDEGLLCVACARARRYVQPPSSDSFPENRPRVSREELIARLDAFFAASGVHEICARCHQQGTGCCPSSCRVLGEAGCDPDHPFGKTVFCATFLCGALLQAITECDPALGRSLRYTKTVLGDPEFHLYQLITRVPRAAQNPEIPLQLPRAYPLPEGLTQGPSLRTTLLPLAEEVLALRRLWQEVERREACSP
jgi:hypothetical protein